MCIRDRYEGMPAFYPGGRWFFPATEENVKSVQSFWHTPDSYPIDNRGLCYSLAFFSAKHLGQSQYYLMCTADKDGAPLKGEGLCRLHVPDDAPVKQYWSMTCLLYTSPSPRDS